ncbi:DUF3244 domain-containing protein [Bacteroides sp. OttesenSCG-928-J23]|nr:DUF3244 domain-containing protein [Bacteroides sp. OttesenSCG-928-J23]MDL2304963.1 DUF3244 domain-containing protein [Bacteroides sp. OttesenSCG-928-D19]
MKKFNLLMLVMVCTLFAYSYSAPHMVCQTREDVLLEGSWGEPEERPRSLKPVPPKAYVIGDVLVLKFETNIYGLNIQITDEYGMDVYNEPFSTPNVGYELEIPLTGCSGVFTVNITHPAFGYVQGTFSL